VKDSLVFQADVLEGERKARRRTNERWAKKNGPFARPIHTSQNGPRRQGSAFAAPVLGRGLIFGTQISTIHVRRPLRAVDGSSPEGRVHSSEMEWPQILATAKGPPVVHAGDGSL
jgi:hypothetical protein